MDTEEEVDLVPRVVRDLVLVVDHTPVDPVDPVEPVEQASGGPLQPQVDTVD